MTTGVFALGGVIVGAFSRAASARLVLEEVVQTRYALAAIIEKRHWRRGELITLDQAWRL